MSNILNFTIMGKRKNKLGFEAMPNQISSMQQLQKKQGNPCEAKAKFTPNKFRVDGRG